MLFPDSFEEKPKGLGEMAEEGEGEGDHVVEESLHVDHLDSDSKTVVQLKSYGRGRGRPRKTQIANNVELGNGKNAVKCEEPLLNQGLNQLPDMSIELGKRTRKRKQLVETGEEDVKKHKPITLPEGILSPQVAVALGSRRITRSLKAYLDCGLVPSAKNNDPDIHGQLTAPGAISASKSSSECINDLGISFAEMAFPSETRCLSQNMKVYFKKCPQRSTPLMSPVRNVMNSAKNIQDHSISKSNIPAAMLSSNHVKNQDLSFSPTTPMYKTAVPSEIGGNQNTVDFAKLGSQSMSKDNGLADVNESASNWGTESNVSRDPYATNDLQFIAGNHRSIEEEEACPPSNANEKVESSRRKLSGACPSRSASLNLTQMCLLMDDDPADFDEIGSRNNEAFVSVNGYEVKAETASILRDIFVSHGDIAKDCTLHAVRSRSCLLENVCGIYRRMEDTNFMLVTDVELNTLLEEVRDLETTKIELGWLHHRLIQIMEAKKAIKTLKEERRRNAEAMERRKQELIGNKKQLESLAMKIQKDENVLNVLEAEEEKIHEKFNNMKSTLKVFYKKSLVHGLL